MDSQTLWLRSRTPEATAAQVESAMLVEAATLVGKLVRLQGQGEVVGVAPGGRLALHLGEEVR